MLTSSFTPAFERDIKRLQRKHQDVSALKEVIGLIVADSPEAKDELRRRHQAHRLSGVWADVSECHIDNHGDWLLIWVRDDTTASFLRTGSHDELFSRSR